MTTAIRLAVLSKKIKFSSSGLRSGISALKVSSVLAMFLPWRNARVTSVKFLRAQAGQILLAAPTTQDSPPKGSSTPTPATQEVRSGWLRIVLEKWFQQSSPLAEPLRKDYC